MKVFLAAVVIIGLCVLGLCANILLKKDGHFPHYDVGSNEEMRKRGIRCFKDEDAMLHQKGHGKKCSGDYSSACEGCKFYELEK